MARRAMDRAATPPAVLGRQTRPRSPLRVIAGGRNRPALVTVPKGELDELRIELQVARTEACELVAELLPVARRIEFYATADGSIGAWNLAARLVDRLTRFARRCEPKPAA